MVRGGLGGEHGGVQSPDADPAADEDEGAHEEQGERHGEGEQADGEAVHVEADGGSGGQVGAAVGDALDVVFVEEEGQERGGVGVGEVGGAGALEEREGVVGEEWEARGLDDVKTHFRSGTKINNRHLSFKFKIRKKKHTHNVQKNGRNVLMLIDWLIEWITHPELHGFIGRSMGWLIDWLSGLLILSCMVLLVNQWVDWLIDWVDYSFWAAWFYWYINGLIDWLIEWITHSELHGFIGRSMGWLIDWLIDWSRLGSKDWPLGVIMQQFMIFCYSNGLRKIW